MKKKKITCASRVASANWRLVALAVACIVSIRDTYDTCLAVWGSLSAVCGLRSPVCGLWGRMRSGLRCAVRSGLKFRMISALRFAVCRIWSLGFRVQGSGFEEDRHLLAPSVPVREGLGFMVEGAGLRVEGSRFTVHGSGFRVQGVRSQGTPPHAGRQPPHRTRRSVSGKARLRTPRACCPRTIDGLARGLAMNLLGGRSMLFRAVARGTPATHN